jgi:hypothetical protein
MADPSLRVRCDTSDVAAMIQDIDLIRWLHMEEVKANPTHGGFLMNRGHAWFGNAMQLMVFQ